jgi:biopolymer transport protein ExbD
MADIHSAVNGNRKAGVRRMIKHHLKIDMTPMVDLGFLLITFFVITMELAKPTVMDLYMPKDGLPIYLGLSNALTVLLDNNKMYYYNGKWEEAAKKGSIIETTLSGNDGLRKIIGDKQRNLDIIAKEKEGRNGLMVLIKPTGNASYKDVVDVLDEMTINVVKKYAVIKISAEEKNWLKNNSNLP